MKATMDGFATIQPFGFDRVFHLVDTHAPEPLAGGEAGLVLPPEDLHEKVAELEARIERLHADHRAELTRARADGFEAGATQARSERAEALLSATDALHAGLSDINARFDTATRAMLAEAGAVVLHAAQLLAGHAIDAAPARAVDEALGRALEQVAQGTALVVRANPAMRGEIEALVAERRARAGRNLAVTVVDDVGVPEGDARIEWSAGGLNVDAEARRAAVMAELAGTLAAA
ncbi:MULTISPECIES: FliH/SctL family protein [unclassified Novosphingobium]|uniref:FliH/SctL family protein n=1 Tax=unclassified Novosphingobium TaxID=2644732 RepID=UPI0013586487|nr:MULTISPECIES: FliH/SctL family protein [unclassified Novosphingobium]